MVAALAVGGVILILSGGLFLYSYVRSRLSSPHPAVPAAALTPVVGKGGESPDDAATSEHPFTFIPTLEPTPGPTPVPVIPDRIFISAIGLDAPVVPVTQTIVWAGGQKQPTFKIPQMRAAGWHETSAPLGIPGNTVLNGHNTNNGEVFRNLYKLEIGDEIVLHTNREVYTYTVTETLILPEAGQPLKVRIENAHYIQPTEDERLTLVTCHPYGSLRNRLIVIAHPAERSTLMVPYPER